MSNTAIAGRSLCTFRLADLHLGVDVTQVQEVIRRQPVTHIPLVSPVLHGLINLRGEIVTAIDLRRRMGIEARTDDGDSMNVIIRTPDGPVSLIVDEIDDVVDADESDFEPPPPTLHGARRHLVTGVFKLERGLLLVLDLDRVLDPSDLHNSTLDSSTNPSPVHGLHAVDNSQTPQQPTTHENTEAPQ